MLKKRRKERTQSEKRKTNKILLRSLDEIRFPIPNPIPISDFQLCANVCPPGRCCCCCCCLWLTTGVTDTRSGCRCRSGTSQGAPSAGEAATGSAAVGDSHVTTRRRRVALHVKFSSLRWKFKSKEMQIRMWIPIWMTVNLSQGRTMWHTFNNDSPQWKEGREGNRESAFVSLSTRGFIAITLILTYYSQIKY